MPGPVAPGDAASLSRDAKPLSRRHFAALVAGAGALTLAPRVLSAAKEEVRFGLTPVFLSSDIELLAQLRTYLSGALQRPVTLVMRRTYQEITALLLSGQLDAAWICGYPYIQYRDRLSLLAVPIWRGLYDDPTWLTRPIEEAHKLGLKIMIGCMIETSVAITAAAHLSPLADYADLDGNLLISNDPFTGATVRQGRLILPEGPGIGIAPRT